ncbi:ArgR family transcriptional regulator [Ligilactobacillus sp. WILCCON 0076]|uniref:Arginine repressor n=1 Tax=Ligilactobacillus ubinensis TaxID=2876789 RepID=A0A9X2JNY8_9LACO|nr:ArgR family transcriptional regulator [Ligilactobacillus ubinensis]MCP0887641.1 ArgR family transcriptional regulator [Ligilactobacillus ubinensis]
MKRDKRRKFIELIIVQNKVSTQEELINLLKENGIETTQATVSRDIRELSIIKERDDSGKICYRQQRVDKRKEIEKLYQAIELYVYSIQCIECINVVHTSPNYANVITAILDGVELVEIVGSIAGYDTIFIISKNQSDADTINKLFKKHIDAMLQ